MGRDAFGRETDTDPLESMGWSSETAQTRPEAQAEIVRDSTAYEWEEEPARTRTGGNRNARQAIVMTTAIFGLVAAVGIGTASGLIDDASDDDAASSPSVELVEDVGGADAVADGGAAADDAAPATPPSGFRSDSLLLRSNFAAALDALRARRYGGIVNLRLAADRLNVQLITRDGRLRNVQVDPDRSVQLVSESGPGFGGRESVPYASIDAAAPYRAARSAAGRSKRSAESVDYLVAFRTSGTTLWGVYLKNGDAYQADGRGRIDRQIG